MTLLLLIKHSFLNEGCDTNTKWNAEDKEQNPSTSIKPKFELGPSGLFGENHFELIVLVDFRRSNKRNGKVIVVWNLKKAMVNPWLVVLDGGRVPVLMLHVRTMLIRYLFVGHVHFLHFSFCQCWLFVLHSVPLEINLVVLLAEVSRRDVIEIFVELELHDIWSWCHTAEISGILALWSFLQKLGNSNIVILLKRRTLSYPWFHWVTHLPITVRERTVETIHVTSASIWAHWICKVFQI